MKKRVKYCDALRFFAMLLVIAIHCFSAFRDSFVATNKFYYFFITLADGFTRAAVPIFFMLTGAFYLSKKSEINYKEFIKKNIPKLIVPFFIISIIYYLFNCFYFKTDTFSVFDFLNKFFSNGIKFHFWFMYSIILIYFFIPFLRILVQNISKKELLILIIIIYILGNILNTSNAFSTKYNFISFSSFTLPNMLIYVNYLFVGYFLFTNEIETKKRIILIIMGVVFTIFMSIADILFINNARNDFMLTVTSAFPVFSGIALFIIFKYYYDKMPLFKKFEKLFVSNNKLIFYIYMFHLLVICCLEKIINKYYYPQRFIEAFLIFIIKYILTVIITFIISYLFVKIFEYLCKIFKKLKNI